MRVPTYEQREPLTPQGTRSAVSVPKAAAGVALTPTDTTKGLASGAGDLIRGLNVMAKNIDEYNATAAINEFKQKNMEFLNARETGLFTREGARAIGAAEAYNDFSATTIRDIVKSRKMSRAQQQIFLNHVMPVVTSSAGSVMRFEAGNVKKARDAELDAFVSRSLDEAMLNVDDADAFENHVQSAVNATRARYRDWGPERIEEECAKTASAFRTGRIEQALRDDPMRARALFEHDKGGLTAKDQLRLGNRIEDETEIYRVQAIADDVMKRGMSEQSALAWTRANHSGKFERQLASEIRMRYNEIDAAQNAAERQQRKAQTALYRNLEKKVANNDTVLSQNVIDGLVNRGRLTDEQGYMLMSKQQNALTRSNIDRNLARDDPHYTELPENEKFVRVSRLTGVTDGERKAARAMAYDQFISGEMDETGLKSMYAQGMISGTDMNAIKTAAKSIEASHKNDVRAANKALTKAVKDYGLDGADVDDIRSEMTDAFLDIDWHSADSRQRVNDALNAAIIRAIDESGKSQSGLMGFGKSRVGKYRDEIEARRGEPAQGYRRANPFREGGADDEKTRAQNILFRK